MGNASGGQQQPPKQERRQGRARKMVKLDKGVPFDPEQFITDVQGNDFLPVAPRVLWARDDSKRNGQPFGLTTEVEHVEWDACVVVWKATATDLATGQVLATGHKRIERAHLDVRQQANWYEMGESGAVGRCLAFLGYDIPTAQDGTAGDSYSPRGDRQGQQAAYEPVTCCQCQDRQLTEGQYKVSMQKFQKPLCPTCQEANRQP